MRDLARAFPWRLPRPGIEPGRSLHRQLSYLRAAQAYMLISMPTGTSTIFGAFQAIRVLPPALVTLVRVRRGCAKLEPRTGSIVTQVVAVASGAVLKFLVLWVGIVQIALSFIPGIKQPQIDAMTAVFSWPQLVTALIGSSFAITVIPYLKKILKFTERNR